MDIRNLLRSVNFLEVKQIREVVDVEEWVEDYYYSGVVSKMYPFWKEKVVEVFRKGVNEVIVIGSLGGGKTTFANALLMRKIYELSCYEPVAGLFGLLSGTTIAFMYFSVSLHQALRTGYGMLMNMIDQTPYFQKVFRRDQEINSIIRFKDIEVYPGSIVEHQIGLGLLGAILDEANFLRAKDPYEKAKKLYTAIINRRKSRFVVKGRDMGLSVLVSSAEEPSSFVEDRISKVGKNRDDVLVVSAVAFELKKKQYKGDKFVVFIGAEFIGPRIVDTVDDLVEVLKYFRVEESVIEEVRKMPVKYSIKYLVPDHVRIYFREVPMEFRQSFEEDVIRAVRDVIGVGVHGEEKLMRSLVAYEECLDKGRKNAFRKEVVQLSNFDDMRLQDYFDMGSLRDLDKGRYVHVDLGTVHDRTGLACAYVGDVKRDSEGKLFPVVYLDFIVGVERSTVRMDDEVPIWKIRDFLIWLRDNGVHIAKITFDRYASEDCIQLLRRAGFNVDILSVDRDDSVYLNLIQLYLERRIRHFEHTLYRRELFGLNWLREKRKVDHPAGGSKDVADAVAGAVYLATKEGRVEMDNIADYVDMVRRQDAWEQFFGEVSKKGKKDIFVTRIFGV